MKKKSHNTKYLAGHQRSWVWGRHAVTEILDAGRWPVLELFLSDDLAPDKLAHYAEQGKGMGADAVVVNRERLRELCGASDSQGFLARMGPYPYATWDEVFEMQHDSTSPPLYLMLDAMRDAHNFGAIIRSAAALQATAVIVGVNDQSPVNNHVVRASAGAVNRIPVVQATSLVDTLHTLQENGVVCAAADPRGTVPVWCYDFKQPTVLVLGNESAGITPELLELCGERLVIPDNDTLDSLNVAAAGAAILYEALRQKSLG